MMENKGRFMIVLPAYLGWKKISDKKQLTFTLTKSTIVSMRVNTGRK